MPKCDVCDKTITKKSPGLECNKCSRIVHANQLCTGLSSKQLSALRNADTLEWTCQECHKDSPRRKSFVVPEDDEEDEDEPYINKVTDGGSSGISKLIKDISSEVKKAVKKEIATVNESLSSCCKKMDDMMHTLEEYNGKIKELEKKNIHLANQNTHLELKVDALEQQVRNFEQQQLNNTCEIAGIPELKDENLKVLTDKIATKLKLDEKDNYTVRRLSGRNGKEGVIQIRFSKENQVDSWIRAARKEIITVEDVISGANPNISKTKVMVRRALTSANKNLLWQAKTKLKDTFKYVWFQDGRVLARKADTDKPVILRSTGDIEKLTVDKKNRR